MLPSVQASLPREPAARPLVCADNETSFDGSRPRRLRSVDLFEGEREIEIAHGDAVYRLRHTSLGKLILTK